MQLVKKTQNGLFVGKSGAFGRALERMKTKREVKRSVRIGFIIDATVSRGATWEQAQTVQGRMFQSVADLRRVSMRLVHFGGNELIDHGWTADTDALAARMAAVRCCPGTTQILPALDLFYLQEADAVILVGDAFEEEAEGAGIIASRLSASKTKVFTFLEGDDRNAANAFRKIAEITGGRFARLGDELPLGDLCEGVALLAAGGEQAVRRLKNEQVRKLLLTGPSSS